MPCRARDFWPPLSLHQRLLGVDNRCRLARNTPELKAAWKQQEPQTLSSILYPSSLKARLTSILSVNGISVHWTHCHCGGREIPNFFILYASPVRFRRSRAAAPRVPPTTQLLSRSARKI